MFLSLLLKVCGLGLEAGVSWLAWKEGSPPHPVPPHDVQDSSLETSPSICPYLLPPQAVQADVSHKRTCAFAKRLLQVALESPANFACGCLILVSEVLKVSDQRVGNPQALSLYAYVRTGKQSRGASSGALARRMLLRLL